MTWRLVPPVFSPVSPAALPGALAVACGLRKANLDGLIAMLRTRHEATEVLLTDSGTSALILAMRATIPAGATVAYPAYGCIDLTTAALGANVKVRLYDIDPVTLSPDLDSVRRAIGRGVSAIVVAHLFGYPADVVGVRRIAAEHGVPVIEDAAQGAGGRLDGRSIGSHGDISVLSFGRGKGLTSGSGGAVLIRTSALEQWAHRTRAMLGPGRSGGREAAALAAQWILARPNLYRIPASIPGLRLGEMVFRPPREPRAIASTAAKLLGAALEMDKNEVRGRRLRAHDIVARLRPNSRMSPVRPIAGGESGYLRLALLDTKGDAVPLPSVGAVRGYPLTLEQHPQLRTQLAPGERAGNGALHLRDRLFTAPTHSRVNAKDLSMLGEWATAANSISLAQLSPVAVS